MKVKEIMKRYNATSNATIFVQNGISGDLVEINRNDIPEYIENATVNSLEVADNVFTIFISFKE